MENDVEARSRLASVLDVCEHEMRALEALQDARLSGVLQAMTTFRAEVVAALADFHARREQRRLDPMAAE